MGWPSRGGTCQMITRSRALPPPPLTGPPLMGSYARARGSEVLKRALRHVKQRDEPAIARSQFAARYGLGDRWKDDDSAFTVAFNQEFPPIYFVRPSDPANLHAEKEYSENAKI